MIKKNAVNVNTNDSPDNAIEIIQVTTYPRQPFCNLF